MRAIGSAPRARIAGVVYLLYLAAVDLAWILVDRRPFACRVALLMSNVLYLMLGVLFYNLFRPVSRRISMDALLFCVAGCTIGILHFFHIATRVKATGFLAIFSLLIGYLMIRSKFLPQILGWLMVLSGLGWLAFLKPSIAGSMHGQMSDFSFFAEGLLALWLLVKGVDMRRWEEQAEAAKATAQ